MKPTPDTIWKVPAYLPSIQPELTDEMVTEAESLIGYRLPSEYLDLLRVQNGGYIRFEFPERSGSKIYGIGPIYPSMTNSDLEESQEYVSYSLQGLVPFDGDGHWYNCVDYRFCNPSPCVTYVDIECDAEQRLADSFAEYLSCMQLKVGSELVIGNRIDVEDVKRELSSLLKVEFENRISNNGVPYHFGNSRSGASHDCVWITPNTVPRNYVRANHPRYSELSSLQVSTASMFPELSKDALIMETTDEMLPRVLDTCDRVGIKLVPIRDYLTDV